MRVALTRAPVLRHPDFTRPFVVKVDASDVAVGGALLQRDDKGRLVVVWYCSKVLTQASERTRSGIGNCSRLFYAVTVEFRSYLWGTHFQVFTDHKSILGTIQSSDWVKLKQVKRRWIERLCGEYSFSVQHCPGKEMVVADALSRLVDTTVRLDGWATLGRITSRAGDCTRKVEVVEECSCGVIDAPYGILGGEDVAWRREDWRCVLENYQR